MERNGDSIEGVMSVVLICSVLYEENFGRRFCKALKDVDGNVAQSKEGYMLSLSWWKRIFNGEYTRNPLGHVL